MTDFQEFPKALYGPEGVVVVVDDAEQEAAQLLEWMDDEEPETDEAPSLPRRRGRPPKVR